MKKTQGFTLIELLVVIAIIGILSSIVIASLNSARTKGAVSAAKGQMAQVRTQAETYYDINGGYAATSTTITAGTAHCNTAGTMFTDTVIAQQLTQISQNASGLACSVSTDKSKWAIGATLKDNTTYCVDNQGTSKASSTVQNTGTCN